LVCTCLRVVIKELVTAQIIIFPYFPIFFHSHDGCRIVFQVN